MKNSKTRGFTLIELLAIIVILAIIAVITVPIILSVIENSRRGAAADSAYGYVDAVNKEYLSDLTLDPSKALLNGIFIIDSNGKLTNNDEVVLNVNVSGSVPEENSWVRLNNGEVVAYSLKFGIYVVTKYEDTEVIVTKDGQIAEFSGMTLGIKVGNIQYYTGGDASDPDNVVYFDPVNGIKNCTTYHEDNSIVSYNGVTKTTDNQTSCLKWYIYSIDDKGTVSGQDDTVNMILDHNTTAGIRWVDNNSGDNCTGPDSAFLSALNSATSEWTSDKILAPTPYNISWDSCGYELLYSGYKARIIDAVEVARITGDSTYSEPDSIKTNLNSFLIVNLSSVNDALRTNYGYYTSSAYTLSNNAALFVIHSGLLQPSFVYNIEFGIRPVITVSKQNVL